MVKDSNKISGNTMIIYTLLDGSVSFLLILEQVSYVVKRHQS